MRYFKLTIAYDGTDFHGWQVQADKPTVQGEIVAVLRRLTEENVQLLGAGRTDAGCTRSARWQLPHPVAALRREFQRALNALLPPAIRIVAAEEKGPAFSARWSAKGKVYRYRIYRGKSCLRHALALSSCTTHSPRRRSHEECRGPFCRGARFFFLRRVHRFRGRRQRTRNMEREILSR